MPRAAFIVLDGLDGTGKSTQCRLLADRLRAAGHDVVTCVDPGGTALGEQAPRTAPAPSRRHGSGLRGAAVHGEPRQLVSRVIRPALDAGTGRGLRPFPAGQCRLSGIRGRSRRGHSGRSGRLSTGGLEPDLTLVLDLPVEQRSAARPAGGSHGEPGPRIPPARAAGFPGRGAAPARAHPSVDASAAVEAVHEAIVRPCSVGGDRCPGNGFAGMTLRSRRFAVPCSAAGWRTPISSPARAGSASGCSPSNWPRRCSAKPHRAELAKSSLNACDRCPACIQIEAGTHPDFFRAVRPEDKHEFPIELMRELCQAFSLKSGAAAARSCCSTTPTISTRSRRTVFSRRWRNRRRVRS